MVRAARRWCALIKAATRVLMSGPGMRRVRRSISPVFSSNWSERMFKRVLLCYDGTEEGSRALRRGAELAVLLGARVSVLSIIPAGTQDAAVAAGAAGHACIRNEAAEFRK